MILGVGIDVVDVERLAERLERVPRLRERLFTPLERNEAVDSLAARFAAKEALAKVLGAPPGLSWQEAEVRRGTFGKPELALTGAAAKLAAEMGITALHVSLSHDAGIATAVVVADGTVPEPQPGKDPR
ncbi:MAG TPA: holo-ACP synthase [Actinomycetales bacterium]|nr:holo-ACP synthase [Actinomycetales bacterium]